MGTGSHKTNASATNPESTAHEFDPGALAALTCHGVSLPETAMSRACAATTATISSQLLSSDTRNVEYTDIAVAYLKELIQQQGN